MPFLVRKGNTFKYYAHEQNTGSRTLRDTIMNKTHPTPAHSRRREWLTFLLITAVFFPLLSIITVGGYGFIVWMLQIFFGPPGHGA